MAKQHERYQDALQELLDNAVSSVVGSESYYDQPPDVENEAANDDRDSVELVITIVRDTDTVKTFVADNGPGISKDDLKNEVFRTGNKRVSDGILNNVGWGLKASIAWFERTLKQHDVDSRGSWFTLVTQTADGPPLRVDGPIVGDLPIREGDGAGWELGLENDPLADREHGTRVHVSCSRSQFDDDVWPSADSLATKAQFLRERLGVLFRRLLEAHPDNRITVNYHDLNTQERGSLDVVPIFPLYEEETEVAGTHEVDEFTVTDAAGAAYKVRYERGTLDFDAMTDAVTDDAPGLLTASERFRYRYRPSQNRQGVDIYANGRVLMTAVFSELFDLTRNNQYNYWGGTLRITPESPGGEVPTDNKKTRIDTNSALWQAIKAELAAPEMQPQGKDYTGTALGNTLAGTGVDDAQTHLTEDHDGSPETSGDATEEDQGLASSAITRGNLDSLFGLHNRDARHLEEMITSAAEAADVDQTGLVDLVITSPPYFDLKDYGYDDSLQVGQDESYTEYRNQLRSIFRQLYNVTRDTGTLWVVINSFRRQSREVQLPADIARICQSLQQTDSCPHCSTDQLSVPLEYDEFSGTAQCRNCEFVVDAREQSWVLRDTLVWDKGRALPYVEDGELRNVYEHILCFSKSESFTFEQDRARVADPSEFEKWWVDYPERYNPRGKLQSNLWTINSPDRGGFNRDGSTHPAALPPELAERILRVTTEPGDVVLDPFAGSGTVLAQATAMDRRAIGFELNSEFCDQYPELREWVHKEYGASAERAAPDETGGDHTGRETGGGRPATRPAELARLISALRQVKYARTHLRQMAECVNVPVPSELDVHTVFQLSRAAGHAIDGPDTHGRADLLYVVDESIPERELKTYRSVVPRVTTEPPLSKFGIDVQTAVVTTSKAMDLVVNGNLKLPSKQLYLYRDGRHYAYSDRVPLSEWTAYMNDRTEWRADYDRFNCPPILSNLRLDVNHARHTLETMDREQSPDHEATLYDASDTAVFDVTIPDEQQS